jgi:hypothetical protein
MFVTSRNGLIQKDVWNMAMEAGRFNLDTKAPTLLYCKQASGSNSVVECQLPKLDVAGSSPVSRSKFS